MPARPGDARTAAAVRNVRETMQAAGFSPTAVEVYVRLLIGGPTTAARLRSVSSSDETALFEATRDLRRHGLIVSYRHKGKSAWYCADPATAWLSLAADVTWRASATLTPLDQLPQTGFPRIDEQSARYRAALRPALYLWTGEIPVTSESQPAHSAGTLAQLAIEAVRVARAHVRSISASPKISGAAQFWPALVAQMRAGVRYTRLTDLNELYEHGIDVVRRDLAEGVDLRIGVQEQLTQTRGYLSDRRILVRYDEAASGERPSSGFMTSDKHAVDRFLRRFNRLAESAVPAEIALDYMEGHASSLRKAAGDLSADALDWLDEMIRMGRFATLPTERKWSEAQRRELERELTAAGVAARTIYGQFLPSWPDPTQTTIRLQGAQAGHAV